MRATEGLRNVKYLCIIAVLALTAQVGAWEADDDPDETAEKKYPVIVIPGIAGSELQTEDYIIWVGVGIVSPGQLALDENGIPVNSAVHAAVDDPIGTTYGAVNFYKTLVNALRSEYGDNNVRFFSYDWRLDATINTKRLETYINKVMEELKAEKINIVAHSMGGLLSANYVALGHQDKIANLITIGTPYLGAPKAVSMFASGKFIEIPIVGAAVEKLLRKISSHLPAIYQLVPPAEVKQRYIGYVDNFDQNNPYNKIVEVDNPQNFMSDNMELIDMDNNLVTQVVKKQFINTAIKFQNDYNYKALLAMDNVHIIVGTDQKSTTNQIIFNHANNRYSYIQDIKFSQGDGTVPEWSADPLPNIKNKYKIKDSHTGLLENKTCLNKVLSILKNSPTGAAEDNDEEVEIRNHQIIRISGPIHVMISFNGEILSSLEDNYNASTSWGSLHIVGENDDVKIIALDLNDEVEIQLIGAESGEMSYRIEYLDETFATEAAYFGGGVFISENTIINTVTDLVRNDDELPFLQIDADGDGATFERFMLQKVVDEQAVKVQNVRNFIWRFYQNCLNRDPENEEIVSLWAQLLLDGQMSGRDFGFCIIASEEFQQRNLSNEEVLEIYYRAFFDRQPDEGGFQGWLKLLEEDDLPRFDATPHPYNNLFDGFAFSPEFIALCWRFGIVPLW